MVEVQRSRPHPGTSLKESLDGLRKLRRSLGAGPYGKLDIAKALGFKGLNGSAVRRIATLVQFGLLEAGKDGNYQVSGLGRRIVATPDDNPESKRLIEEAFRHPALYAELLAKYEPEGELPRDLSTLLYTQHRVSIEASRKAADTFLDSARFAGVVDEQGQFAGASLRETDEGEEEEAADERPMPATRPAAPPAFGPDEQVFNLALTDGGFARLSVPATITARDIARIKALLAVLELQVEQAGADADQGADRTGD